MSGREGSAQARARMLLTPPTFKERLSVDSPFNYLTISHNDIKQLIADEKMVEKALKMSFLPCTLRWIIMLHSHNVNFVSILHFLISFYLSCIDIKIEENLQSMVIQPEDNLDPAVGPVLRLYMNYDPSLSGKGVGKGRSPNICLVSFGLSVAAAPLPISLVFANTLAAFL